MSELEPRVNNLEKEQIRTEETLRQYGKRLDTLHTDYLRMNETLQGILATLNQIKWVGTGVLVTVIANQVGLLEILKQMILP